MSKMNFTCSYPGGPGRPRIRRKLRQVLAIPICSLLLQVPMAQAAGQDPIAGIVTDQTRTEMGHTFYQAFSATWRDRDIEGSYSLSVAEVPSARQGSLITIEHGQRRVFQARIPRNADQIRKMADQVAHHIFDDVALAELNRKLFRDPDLGREDL